MAADDYRQKFADFLVTQSIGAELGHERIVRAKTREELGISSLNMITLLMGYIKKYTDGSVTLRPEWVLRLNDVDGIASVLRDIDATEPARS